MTAKKPNWFYCKKNTYFFTGYNQKHKTHLYSLGSAGILALIVGTMSISQSDGSLYWAGLRISPGNLYNSTQQHLCPWLHHHVSTDQLPRFCTCTTQRSNVRWWLPEEWAWACLFFTFYFIFLFIMVQNC